MILFRLGTFGFFYSDELDDVKGNQGFWDQAMALQWIKDNIRYFGGDPNAITISGESAGSWSVSALIMSPVTRDLFNKAIMMSGSSLFRVFSEPQELVQNLLIGIRKFGCATDDDKTISKKIVDCLQELDADKLDKIVHVFRKDLFGMFNCLVSFH